MSTASRASSPGARRSGCTSGRARAANSAASSPPVPARISSRTFLSSLGSFGISRIFSSSMSGSRCALRSLSSSCGEVAHLRVAAALHQLLGLRELGGDDLVLAVLQHQRLDVGSASWPACGTRSDRSGRSRSRATPSAPRTGFRPTPACRTRVVIPGKTCLRPKTQDPRPTTSSARHRRQERDFVAVGDSGWNFGVVGVDGARDRAPVGLERRVLRAPASPTRRRPWTPAAPRARARRRPARSRKPGEQADGHAHAILSACSRASASSGSAVAPSIHASPPSKYSCFQIGTICLMRSIA